MRFFLAFYIAFVQEKYAKLPHTLKVSLHCPIEILNVPHLQPVFRIRFILIWIRIRIWIRILLQIRPKIGKISIFYKQKLSLRNMI